MSEGAQPLTGTNDEGQCTTSIVPNSSNVVVLPKHVYERMISVPRLMVSSPFLCWLMPVNTFGVTAGFLFSCYYDNTIAAYLEYIGGSFLPSAGYVLNAGLPPRS